MNNLIELYEKISTTASECVSQGAKPVEVAPILIRIGLELYKMSLTPEDFEKIVDTISENRDQIKNPLDQIKKAH